MHEPFSCLFYSTLILLSFLNHLHLFPGYCTSRLSRFTPWTLYLSSLYSRRYLFFSASKLLSSAWHLIRHRHHHWFSTDSTTIRLLRATAKIPFAEIPTSLYHILEQFHLDFTVEIPIAFILNASHSLMSLLLQLPIWTTFLSCPTGCQPNHTSRFLTTTRSLEAQLRTSPAIYHMIW